MLVFPFKNTLIAHGSLSLTQFFLQSKEHFHQSPCHQWRNKEERQKFPLEMRLQKVGPQWNNVPSPFDPGCPLQLRESGPIICQLVDGEKGCALMAEIASPISLQMQEDEFLIVLGLERYFDLNPKTAAHLKKPNKHAFFSSDRVPSPPNKFYLCFHAFTSFQGLFCSCLLAQTLVGQKNAILTVAGQIRRKENGWHSSLRSPADTFIPFLCVCKKIRAKFRQFLFPYFTAVQK